MEWLDIPVIRMDRNIENGPFLHGDGRHLLARFGGDRERQRDHFVPSSYPSKHPDDGVQTHRLLNER